MLPLYGKVKAFLFDSATCVSLRPGSPPSVGSEQMKKETEEIYNFYITQFFSIENPLLENLVILVKTQKPAFCRDT